MGARLHPEFPETPDTVNNRWDYPVPLDDLSYALESAGEDGLLLSDLAEITDYSIRYHDEPWSPGHEGGTELSMILIGRLKDGRWIALEAWNDYTGWGCQDGIDAYLGDTREDVVDNGLTNDGRSALGLALVE